MITVFSLIMLIYQYYVTSGFSTVSVKKVQCSVD